MMDWFADWLYFKAVCRTCWGDGEIFYGEDFMGCPSCNMTGMKHYAKDALVSMRGRKRLIA